MNKRNLIGTVLVMGLLLTTAGPALAQEPDPENLILCNTLGSQAEVENSAVGPDGAVNGGSFVPGRFGGAYSADYTQDLLVSFPKEVIPIDAGTIEYWGKLTGFPDRICEGGCGHKPYFVSIYEGWSAFQMGFEGNDGSGNGGLCGDAGGGPSLGFFTGTGGYSGSWTYEQILGAGQVEDWHHYALVWDKNGIAGVADGTKKVAVFLDGQLESGRWHTPSTSVFVPLTGGELGLIDNWGSQGTAAIDNLKIWSYAKTDFSDRFNECAIVVSIDIKPGSEPNNINLRSRGKVWVAVLTADDFDATTVDPDTVLFAGAQPVRWKLKDADGDGDQDKLFQFKTEELDLTPDSTEATLTGETTGGQYIEGTDSVRIVPKGK